MEHAQDIRLSPNEWDAFRRGFSEFRFADVVDRAELGLPAWFMPNARGAVVPSAQVLKPISGRRVRPGYWSEIMPGTFRQSRGQFGPLTIRFGALWSLVRWGKHPTALSYYCGSTPVMFGNYREAMWFCRYLQDEQLAGRDATGPLGYCWTPILPSLPNPTAVAELAAYRSSLEAADRAYWLRQDWLHGRGPALAA